MADTSSLGNTTAITNVVAGQKITGDTFIAMLDVLEAMRAHTHTYTDTWSSNCNCNCACSRGQI
jgi:hypothetical protein